LIISIILNIYEIEKGGFFENLGFGSKYNNKDKNSTINSPQKPSLELKNSIETKFVNSENELIKINKKLNNILQVIEIENQKLAINVNSML